MRVVALSARVEVLVRDKETKRPVPWTLVLLGEYKDATDEEGLAVFEEVPPGRYTLRVRSLLYRPYTAEVEVSPGVNRFEVELTYALL